jgi:hypothetical protein
MATTGSVTTTAMRLLEASIGLRQELGEDRWRVRRQAPPPSGQPPVRRLPRFEDEVDKNHIQVSVYGLRFCNAYHFIYHYGYHYPMRAGENW